MHPSPTSRKQKRDTCPACALPEPGASDWMEGMTDTNSKPEVDAPEGPAPVELVIEDIVVGDGPEATPGSTVDVHYLGVEYDSGAEFDSSWSRGQSINFPLAALITGWQEGIPGMKVGGRRKLTVPPHQAYGPAGGGHQLSGKTLIFVIDLLGVS
ncbi:peptidyl-prolyl cis-trans isomerase [Agromyces rhizosphaerae]|uniref:Peptidyl-prolyl cis-trans isomerase n=2 Tax=Agromyces rhizosphaerae TaxID=88374 RepID=A0A9W6FMG5_9MICO|nr:peptidyl-prolyl cis-trans isomerase [Agromyces rhizosphaerae]